MFAPIIVCIKVIRAHEKHFSLHKQNERDM